MMHIESLCIQNYRALQNFKITDIPKMAVFIGHNGTGKTTFFDVFSFLHDCLTKNVRYALAIRGGFHDVVSREQDGDLKFELEIRPSIDETRITYELTVGLDTTNMPIVKREILRSRQGQYGTPWKILDFALGEGVVMQGGIHSISEAQCAARKQQKLSTQDILAIKGLGQFEDFPAIAFVRRLIEDWHVSDFSIENSRTRQIASYSDSLSSTGDNLAQVARYIYDNHPDRFERILLAMRERIPGIDDIEATLTEDGYVVLRFQDGCFRNPFSSKFVSDGTMKMFAYLLLLSEPSPHTLLCVEEPETQLYPQLLAQLAEDFRIYSSVGGQVFISTHSPDFLNVVYLDELYCLVKGNGYTKAVRASDSALIKSLYKESDLLGELWNQNILLTKAEKL